MSVESHSLHAPPTHTHTHTHTHTQTHTHTLSLSLPSYPPFLCHFLLHFDIPSPHFLPSPRTLILPPSSFSSSPLFFLILPHLTPFNHFFPFNPPYPLPPFHLPPLYHSTCHLTTTLLLPFLSFFFCIGFLSTSCHSEMGNPYVLFPPYFPFPFPLFFPFTFPSLSLSFPFSFSIIMFCSYFFVYFRIFLLFVRYIFPPFFFLLLLHYSTLPSSYSRSSPTLSRASTPTYGFPTHSFTPSPTSQGSTECVKKEDRLVKRL